MRDFKKYEVWQQSHAFTLEIYKITSVFSKEELYGLTSFSDILTPTNS